MMPSLLPLELLRDGFAVRMRVTGRSMTPYLAENDLVTLEPVEAANIRPGDLVYVRMPGLPPLLHRVIRRQRGSEGGWAVHTKGDALVMSDAAVPARFVAGRVAAIRRDRPDGTCREVDLRSPRQRVLQRCLAAGSRHAPRLFAALSRRLTPNLERLAGWSRRTP